MGTRQIVQFLRNEAVVVNEGDTVVGEHQVWPVVSVGAGNLTYTSLSFGSFGIPFFTDHVVAVGAGGVVAVGAGNVVAVPAANLVGVGAGGLVGGGAGNVVSVGAGNFNLFDRGGNVVAVGAGNVTRGLQGQVVAVGAGNVVAVGAGNVVAVGAGNLAATVKLLSDQAALGPILTAGNLRAAGPGISQAAAAKRPRLDVTTTKAPPSAGVMTESVSARLGHGKRVVLFKGRKRFTRPGVQELKLKLTRKGRKLLLRLAKRGRKPHIRAIVRTDFKPRHGKKVTVTRGTRARRR
jgi:hypothetical protein